MVYTASPGTSTKIITVLTIVILGGVCYLVIAASMREPGIWRHTFGLILGVGIPSAVLVISYLFHTTKYLLEKRSIVVKRPIGDVYIDLIAIKNIYWVKSHIGQVTRSFADGGLFGFFGQFNSSRFGNMTWYATRRKNYLIIETVDERIVLTPDNHEMYGDVKKAIASLPEKNLANAN